MNEIFEKLMQINRIIFFNLILNMSQHCATLVVVLEVDILLRFFSFEKFCSDLNEL